MPKIIKTKKKRDKSYSKPVLYVFSVLKGLLIFITGILMTSILILKTSSSSQFFYIFAYLILALGAFISGFDAYRKIKGRGFVNGLIASAAYAITSLIIITISLKFDISLQVLLILPISLISGFLGGTVGANT